MRKVAIIGSRRRKDRQTVFDFVSRLPADTVIVSGGATGPDTWAEEAAAARGLACVVMRPEQGGAKSYHQATMQFYARNQRVVDESDEVVALVAHDRKGGTEDTIRRAKAKGIPVTLL